MAGGGVRLALQLLVWLRVVYAEPHLFHAQTGPDISIHIEDPDLILQFSWSGPTDVPTSGITWYLSTPDGPEVEIAVGHFDRLGFHLLRSSNRHSGDSILRYSPPLKGTNVTNVYIAGWLRLPTGATGSYRCAGYGWSVPIYVLPPAEISVSSDPDDSVVAPFSYGCGSSEASNLSETVGDRHEVHWWTRGRYLGSIVWDHRRNLTERGRVFWARPLDETRPYSLHPLTGALQVFDRPAEWEANVCLYCMISGTTYVTSYRLNCPVPGLYTPPSRDSAVRPMKPPAEARREPAFLIPPWLTWTGIVIVLLCTLGMALLIGGSIVHERCASSRSPAFVDDDAGGPDYKRLEDSL
uniref:Membrane protein m166 n=1 Tax=Mastomys natalensis cytomegalovirus 2 TaxID=2973540 RepID=A0A9Y1ILQ7_9BETA|nr:membrane protein m166 [Mastomys natalensis cytomegalovirus 2]